jgi:hypothetical protein
MHQFCNIARDYKFAGTLKMHQFAISPPKWQRCKTQFSPNLPQLNFWMCLNLKTQKGMSLLVIYAQWSLSQNIVAPYSEAQAYSVFDET